MKLPNQNEKLHVCPKTGRPLTQKPKRLWLYWLFPFAGLVSLVWFLIRVIPKPSRAAYPCQRIAAPIATGFVVWISGLIASAMVFKKAKQHIYKSRYFAATVCIAIAIAAIWVPLSITSNKTAVADAPFTPNAPIGTAKGIFPGRVVWVHNPNATSWVKGTGRWWDYISMTDVNNMMAEAVRKVAGTTTNAAAWDAIFKNFNNLHGKGTVGYAAGEKIAIKVNLNTCLDGFSLLPPSYDKINDANGKGKWYWLDCIDTSPQMILALLRQLVNVAGVSQNKIYVYDSIREFCNQYYTVCHNEFSNVNYVDARGGSGRTLVTQSSSQLMHWSVPQAGKINTDYIPSCVEQAAYVISLSALKGHDDNGVTMRAKNHYGSFLRAPNASGRFDLHATRAHETPGMGNYRALVDIMGHKDLGGKTLLFLIDGLYGGPASDSVPVKWLTAPFNNDWPSSLLASQDGVAIDSVGFDLLRTEWSNGSDPNQYPLKYSGVEDYLHEASQANSPPSGTFYDPEADGTRLTSLGVHEHWNNAANKQYSRNLGTSTGIELISPYTNSIPKVEAGTNQSIDISVGTVNLDGTVTDDGLPNPPAVVTTQWTAVSGPNDVIFGNPSLVDTTASFSEPGLYTLRLTASDSQLSASDTVTVTVTILGDLNGDYYVDFRDFALFAQHWLDSGCGTCGGADLTGDGNVNNLDLKKFAENWLK